MAKKTDKAKWIWIARECHTEDFYLRARRTFRLEAKPASARLRITAFSAYELYVNGQFIGRGPAPSSAAAPQLDVYTEADLPLAAGPNVIAVLAHNPYVGLARQPRLPAGLWMQLDVTGPRGKVETIVTDKQWRVAPADDFSRRAPRIFWTAGFTEVRDTRYEPARWTTFRFADRKWAAANVVDHEYPPETPPQRFVERAVPRPTAAFVLPTQVTAAGRMAAGPGLSSVPFEFCMPNPMRGEFYAATFVHTRARQKARLAFDCDESAAVYINNRMALRQGYSEPFAAWLADEEHDDYNGIHRGQGPRSDAAYVVLDPGWNSVGVVIYDPGTTWGFAVRFEDPRTGDPLPVTFSPDMKDGDMTHWHIVHEDICPCGDGTLPDTPAPNERTMPDAAYQLAWETPKRAPQAARGAETLLAGATAEKAATLALHDTGFAAYDFGAEVVGYIEMDVDGPPGGILDVAWSEDVTSGGTVEAVRRTMRQVDRLTLAGGPQTVRMFGRRAFRYLQLIARLGDPKHAVKVARLGVWSVRQPVKADVPEAADKDLAGAMAIAGRTVETCLQDTFEGSPGREAEQSLPAAYLLAQAERTLIGRTTLGEPALRAFAADQQADGYFRAVVPAGTIHTVPDWNLLWVLWLAEHVAWTGDRKIAADLYPAAEKCLDWTAQFRDSFGLLENRAEHPVPWWLFADLSNTDKRGEVTAWQALYVRALRAAADVADFLGQDEAAEHGRTEADTVAKAARERLWSPLRGLFVDARLFERPSRYTSAVANYYALYGGLADVSQTERILAFLWSAAGKGVADWGRCENPYVKFFALEALLERGQADRALTLIRSYWGKMAREGLATVPEVFPLAGAARRAAGPAGDEGCSYIEGPYGARPPEALCHGWGVHPASLVARYVLGVHPAAPGFEPALLSPMPGGLSQISGRVWTPKGPVEVSIGRDGRGREIRFALPDGMPYRLDRRHLADEDQVAVTGGKAV